MRACEPAQERKREKQNRKFASSISQDVVDFVFSQVRMLARSQARSVRMLLNLHFRLFACSQDRKLDQFGGDKTFCM